MIAAAAATVVGTVSSIQNAKKQQRVQANNQRQQEVANWQNYQLQKIYAQQQRFHQKQQREITQEQAALEQKNNMVQNKLAQLNRAAAVKQAYARVRIQQADILQQAAGLGVSGSSSATGAVGGLATGFAGNVGVSNMQLASQLYKVDTLNRISELNANRPDAPLPPVLRNAQGLQSYSPSSVPALASGVASVANTFGSFEAFKNIFS